MALRSVPHVVKRSDTYNDSGVKNKWRWEWCEKSIRVKSNPDVYELIGEHFRKLSTAGIARCELCLADVSYALRGYVTLSEHLGTKKHRERYAALDKNSTLPGM